MKIKRPVDLLPHYKFKVGMVLKKNVIGREYYYSKEDKGTTVLIGDKIYWVSGNRTWKVHKSGTTSTLFKKNYNNLIKEGDLVGCGVDEHEYEIFYIFLYKK